MVKKSHILITNDDGIDAPGIWHLWKALSAFADLTIVAPAAEQSGAAVALTLRMPLSIQKVKWEAETAAWKVSGTPVDCVRFALSVILPTKPDLIVSGVNRGSNAGRNVLYSGTVGGVIEGAHRGIPGIAFSCENFESPQYHVVEEHILRIVEHMTAHPLPSGTLLNVNFPHQVPKGIRLARQGKGYWVESPEKSFSPDGHPHYWHGGRWHAHDEHEESDVALLKQGYTAAVPIHVGELTDYNFFNQRKDSFEQLF